MKPNKETEELIKIIEQNPNVLYDIENIVYFARGQIDIIQAIEDIDYIKKRILQLFMEQVDFEYLSRYFWRER